MNMMGMGGPPMGMGPTSGMGPPPDYHNMGPNMSPGGYGPPRPKMPPNMGPMQGPPRGMPMMVMNFQ